MQPIVEWGPNLGERPMPWGLTQRLACIAAAAYLLIAGPALAASDEASGGFVLLLLLGVGCYFLPTIIAMSRGKANGTGGVFFVNLILGWTVVGWFVSFIWACSGLTTGQVRREEQRHVELMSALKTKD